MWFFLSFHMCIMDGLWKVKKKNYKKFLFAIRLLLDVHVYCVCICLVLTSWNSSLCKNEFMFNFVRPYLNLGQYTHTTNTQLFLVYPCLEQTKIQPSCLCNILWIILNICYANTFPILFSADKIVWTFPLMFYVICRKTIGKTLWKARQWYHIWQVKPN